MPRYIDAEFAEKEITSLVAEYENRIPEWSPDDMLTSGKDAAMKYGYKADGAEKALEIVNKIPTANVQEVKHGHWVNETYCSVCGRFPVDTSESISNRRLTKFFDWCPHCGAKLIEGE